MPGTRRSKNRVSEPALRQIARAREYYVVGYRSAPPCALAKLAHPVRHRCGDCVKTQESFLATEKITTLTSVGCVPRTNDPRFWCAWRTLRSVIPTPKFEGEFLHSLLRSTQPLVIDRLNRRGLELQRSRRAPCFLVVIDLGEHVVVRAHAVDESHRFIAAGVAVLGTRMPLWIGE